MEIHEITRLKTQKLDEVNFSAIPGALGGMVKQAIMTPGQDRVGPVAAVGQEKAVASQLTSDLYAKAAKQADQNWRKGVMTQLANFKYNTQNWNRTDIEAMLRDYVQNRLLRGQQISDPKVDNQIRKIAYKTSGLGSLSTPADMKKWDQLAADWPTLITAIQNAQTTRPVTGRGAATQIQTTAQQATQLTPQAQAHLQTLAPGIKSLQQVWPAGQTTRVPATSNQAINALLSGMGLLI